MKKVSLHIFIQFLILAFVSLGFGQAGMTSCPPQCPHCLVEVAASCCADGTHANRAHSDTGKTKSEQSDSCDQDAFCPGTTEQEEAIAGFSQYPKDFHHPLTSVFRVAQVFSASNAAIVRYNPPPHKSPPIYDRNCSYLI